MLGVRVYSMQQRKHWGNAQTIFGPLTFDI